MLMLLLYGSFALLFILYVMRALLMSGYDNLNVKHIERTNQSVMKGWVNKMLRLKPITQMKLNPRSIDHKIHMRFQKKATLYYYGIWACMFAILFLAAKIYLDAF
jgi:ABC-type multidrug transport system fused ATPase/permease subunit